MPQQVLLYTIRHAGVLSCRVGGEIAGSEQKSLPAEMRQTYGQKKGIAVMNV